MTATKNKIPALFTDVIPVSPSLAKAIGVCEAMIVQQVHYWCSMKRNHREGHYWVYKTYPEWEAELQVFSSATIRRAIDHLRKLKILVTSRNLNKFGFDKTLWYRLDTAELAKITPSAPPKCADPYAQIEQTDMVSLSTPIPETTPKTTGDINTAGKIPQKTNTQPQDPTVEIWGEIKKTVPTSNTGKDMKAEDILNTLNTKSIPKDPVMLWKKRMGVLQEKYQNLTKADEAKLRQAAKKIGADSLLVIDYAVQHWNVFSLQAKKDKGAYVHEVPTTGFLLQHWESAVVAYQQHVAYEASKVAVICNQLQKPVKPKDMTPVIVDNGPSLTKEEIEADLSFFLKKG